MCVALGLRSSNLEKQDAEFLYVYVVRAVVSFPGKRKVSVWSNNNNVKEKTIVKPKDRVCCLLFFKIMTVGSLPTERDTIYFLMMSCFPEKQSAILSTPYGGGKTDSTVFHLLDCLLHFCIHNLCGGLCDCQNIQMDLS